MHGQGGNSIYEMINGSFAFGDTGFHGATSYFYQTNGFPLNQSLTLNLMMLTWQVMGNTKDMAEFRGSYGDFFAIEYLRQLQTNPNFKSTPWSLAAMMRHFAHTNVNSYFASENWYQISARLAALTEGTEGNQWLTWKDKGFVTVFDFLSVKISFVRLLRNFIEIVLTETATKPRRILGRHEQGRAQQNRDKHSVESESRDGSMR